jgi:18S rRNA (adenine1779-N6/adenine1780-N6)-dimethyltransferase
LRAVLTTKSVLKLLEENRKTVQALNGMEEDNRPVLEIIEEILLQETYQNQRASKLDLDDFLGLLAEFNAKGIHFS